VETSTNFLPQFFCDNYFSKNRSSSTFATSLFLLSL